MATQKDAQADILIGTKPGESRHTTSWHGHAYAIDRDDGAVEVLCTGIPKPPEGMRTKSIQLAGERDCIDCGGPACPVCDGMGKVSWGENWHRVVFIRDNLFRAAVKRDPSLADDMTVLACAVRAVQWLDSYPLDQLYAVLRFARLQRLATGGSGRELGGYVDGLVCNHFGYVSPAGLDDYEFDVLQADAAEFLSNIGALTITGDIPC